MERRKLETHRIGNVVALLFLFAPISVEYWTKWL
jgi:hypothetical protein